MPSLTTDPAPAFALGDDQRQLQDLIRRVAREKVAPRANAIDAKAEYPQDMFDLLRERLDAHCSSRSLAKLLGACLDSLLLIARESDSFCDHEQTFPPLEDRPAAAFAG